MKKKIMTLIAWIVRHPWINLCVAGFLILSGFNEAWATLKDDLLTLNFKGHHGMIVVGLMHGLKALETLVTGLEKTLVIEE